jgi:signal transduction histidine kinase
MCTRDEWPYIPDRLRDFVDGDNLAALEAGLSERIGRPVTLLDYDPSTESLVRIESIRERQRYEPCCKLLRDERLVKGGDEACKAWDLEQAAKSLKHYYETGETFRLFTCYMGLIDVTQLVCIRGHPVAILVSGQYRPPDGPEPILERVRQLGSGPTSHIELSESTRQALLESVHELPPTPRDVRQRLEAAAATIERIAVAEFELRKARWEQEFLDQLRHTSIKAGKLNRQRLRDQVQQMLEQISGFCRCTYAVFFGSFREHETVLAAVAQAGVPPAVAESLPHFNWKKAGLGRSQNGANRWPISRGSDPAGARGIRGDNSAYFSDASCIIPTALGDRYLGVLILGPIEAELDLAQENRFLCEMANVVGLVALTGLQVLFLERERSRWQSTAKLLTHQLRTALTPIASQVGIAHELIVRGDRIDTRRVGGLLESAEDLALRVADRARQTVQGHVLLLEAEDLDIERHPLSVLVANCAAGYADRARQNGLKLEIDERVEYLPEADVDVARMTIALANLLDNAVKYSFPGTVIYVRSHYEALKPVKEANAVIEVDNLGYEITQEDRERIFERGIRGRVAARQGHIEGSGLGLWEVHEIAAAHGGKISMRCDRTFRHTKRGLAHHTVFAITIPLRQAR